MGGVLALQPGAQAMAGPFGIGQVVGPLRQWHMGLLCGSGQFWVGVARDAQQVVAWHQQLLRHGQAHAPGGACQDVKVL